MNTKSWKGIRSFEVFGIMTFFLVVSGVWQNASGVARAHNSTLIAPLVEKGHPVDWWFVFKLNAKVFPGCGTERDTRACIFGGEIQNYTYGQQYLYASNESPTLKQGKGCVGDTLADPVGATFDEVYGSKISYVVWNDQFYGDPPIKGCTDSCSSPWGHSKGLLAWNESGEGLVMQVTTPSWPGSGSKANPRVSDGNTLGCIKDDNVLVSQHFFALRLNKDDVVQVLNALINASVVTNPSNAQIVKNGGPQEIQSLVSKLGKKTTGRLTTKVQLSSGVTLISKPSNLNVPPWQLISAMLGGVSLRTATWWARPTIPSTTDTTSIDCWNDYLGKPGAVAIATSGQWGGSKFNLKGGPGSNFNHAKIGVATSGGNPLAIFGDLNQQGALSGPNCKSSQNGRGGLFYVIEDKALSASIMQLISGDTAPTQ